MDVVTGSSYYTVYDYNMQRGQPITPNDTLWKSGFGLSKYSKFIILSEQHDAWWWWLDDD